MKKIFIPLIAFSLTQPALAADSMTAALEASKPVLDLRLRYESNDTAGNFAPKGDKLTLKSVVGIKTGDFNGFSAYADMANVSALDEKHGEDPVPDVEGDELNQAYIQYKMAGHQFRFGRQRIIYDNARFIGNVGWRQNEQTFDALSYKNTSIENVTFNLAYLAETYGINFSNSQEESVLANIGIAKLGPGELSAYVYALDNGAGTEDTTYGASYSAAVDMYSSMFLFKAELAAQEVKAAAAKNDMVYVNVEAGAKVGGITAKLGYELLGSDNGTRRFDTRLGTKHKFNGWADKFLNPTLTPQGLEDSYFSVAVKAAGVKWVGVYHTYSSDEGGFDLGREIDLLAIKKLTKNYTVGAKLASFTGETGGPADTNKVWLWGQATF